MLLNILAILAVTSTVSGLHRKIVGGEDASEAEFPHQISLQDCSSSFGCKHACGGTLLRQDVVLTASHCVLMRRAKDFRVAAGLTSLSDRFGTNKTLVEIDTFRLHPTADVALVLLKTALPLGPTIAVARLPQLRAIPVGQAILSGWGSIGTGYDPVMPDRLQKATLPLLDHQECREHLLDPSRLKDVEICTGPLQGSLSACSGDSGGPLIQKNGSETTVIGIVAWGVIPCGSGYPTVYTRVSAFNEWIESRMP